MCPIELRRSHIIRWAFIISTNWTRCSALGQSQSPQPLLENLISCFSQHFSDRFNLLFSFFFFVRFSRITVRSDIDGMMLACLLTFLGLSPLRTFKFVSISPQRWYVSNPRAGKPARRARQIHSPKFGKKPATSTSCMSIEQPYLSSSCGLYSL